MAAYGQYRKARTPTANLTDERYRLLGMNQTTPDELMPSGEGALALNCRMYARDGEKRFAIKTRRGPAPYSASVGSTADVTQSSTTGQTDLTFNKTKWVAQKFTATTSGRINRIEFIIKKNTGTGSVIAAIYTDTGTSPGTLIATGGFSASKINPTYTSTVAHFIEAPTYTAGTSYWVVLYAQDDATNFYHAATTTAGLGASTSINSGGTWSVQAYSLQFIVHKATAQPVIGVTRRYPVNKVNETHFVSNGVWYKINDTDGTLSTVATGLSTTATNVRFAHFNDFTIMVNGIDQPRKYDGTTVTTMANVPFIPNNVVVHKNRVFFTTLTDPTRVFFSELADENTYPVVNFFYVPAPKSSDPITAMTVFQDNLVVLTRTTKYVIVGSDISSFTQRQSIGSKGAFNQEGVWSDRNYVYFISNDGVYRWNGVSDDLLTDKVQPEFNGIANLNTAMLAIWNNQLRIYYTPAGQSANSKMLLLDLIYNQWFMDDNHFATYPLLYDRDTNTPLIEFSSLISRAMYAERDFNNMGAPLNFKYWTSYNKYVSAASKTRIRVFRPIIKPSGYTFTMQLGKDVDFQNAPVMNPYVVLSSGATWGGGYTWGAASANKATWGSSTLVDNKAAMSGRGKHTQYRFERYGADTPVQLYGYIAILKSGRIG